MLQLKRVRFVFLMAVLTLTSVSCDQDQLYDNVVLETSFEASRTPVSNNLTLENANLRVAAVDVTGIRNSAELISTSYTPVDLEGTFNLMGSDANQPVRLSVNKGRYDSMKIILRFSEDKYQLIVTESTPESPVDGNDGGDSDDGADPDSEGDPEPDESDGGSEDGDNDSDGSGDDGSPDDDSDNDSDGDGNSDNDTDDDTDDNDNSGGNDGSGSGGDDNDSDDDEGSDDDDSDDDGSDDDDSDDDDSDDNGSDDDDSDDDKKDDKDKDKNKDKDKEKDKDKDEKGDKDKKDKDDKDKDKDKSNDDKGKGKGKKGGRSEDVTVTTVDLDNFFANAKPSILASLHYQNGTRSLRVLVSIDNFSELTFDSKGKSYTLSDQYGNTARATFHIDKWFSNITTTELESASIIRYQNENLLLIHRQFNSTLYAKILQQLTASTSLEVNLNSAGATGF